MRIPKVITKKLGVVIIGVCALSSTVLYAWYYFDIGINSAYQAKHDFTKAFEARQTGNCDDFINWISDEFDSDWKERCIAEKNGDGKLTIVSFEIQSLQISGDKAFLLVELQRSSTGKEKVEPYSVNYELIRHRVGLSSWWLLNQPVQK